MRDVGSLPALSGVSALVRVPLTSYLPELSPGPASGLPEVMDAAQALDALKMTDAEIADAVGVSERTVREWRRGGGVRGRPRKELARLCRDRALLLEVAAKQLGD